MKRYYSTLILAMTLTSAAIPAMGQTADSTAARPGQKEQVVDKDGDGIRDSTPARGERMRRGKDRFIDKDGDGICDGREGGLGLRHRWGRNGSKQGDAGKKGGNQ
jgi:hypothetical protein